MKESNNKRTKKKVKIFSKKKNVDSIDKVIKTLESAEIDISKVKTFKNLPLSPSTLKGLSENGYDIPTEIQRESLVFTLQGLDILGAAKTGSGKTLAFLIPVLEILFKKKWTKLDGVGALIITPTRELAYQIFETIKKVGFHHDFSVGLIIGGKDLHFEKHRMDRVNIVICTPGRLLHHMDENPLFDCVNLQILVLDEADRCLDLGFEKTMNSIIENLPAKRQTLLFSATQTRSVKDLARLSLKDPKYVSVHEHSQYSTPEGLTQSYVVCDLHDKMAMLWSFIKNHPKHKIIVFLSSCKQVKYTFEILCKLRPFTALLALYGSLHQERRMTIYNSFVSKHNAVLLATDIAARGLDFPEVNWVVQLDCPEDANTYIHRAGRTARFQKGGESLLVLLPSEKEAMLENLQEKKIPINEIKINPLKLTNPQVKMEAFLARDPNLKASAQRAFVAYLKSVFLMKDKKVFNINALNCDTYARSLGLVVAPRIRFLQKHNKTLMQNTNKTENTSPTLETEETESDDKQSIQLPIPKGKEVYNFGGGDSDSEDDLLVIKRQDHQLEGGNPEEDEEKYMLEQISNTMKKKPLTKVALAKKLLKKNIVPNKKVVFTDTGETMEDQMKAKTTEEGRQYEAAGEGGIDITEAKKVMRAEDKIDRKLFREKIKAKHREERFKEKKMNKKQKENENKVDAYSGSESEGSEPDLSWLPDPDKLYGEKSADCSGAESHSEDENDSSERIPTRLTGKNVKAKNKNKSMFQKEETSFRKKRSGNSDSENEAYTELQDNEHYDGESTQQGFSCLRKKGKNKHKESNPAKKLKIAQGSLDDDKTFDTGLSLKEDEELVLKFLSSKR